jgi:hypothetical protein
VVHGAIDPDADEFAFFAGQRTGCPGHRSDGR